MDHYIDKGVQGIGTVIRNLGALVSGLTEVHWALIMVVVIGTGVLFMRGKTVRGA